MIDIAPFAELINHYGVVVVMIAISVAVMVVFIGLFTWFIKKSISHNFEHDRFMQDIRDESRTHSMTLQQCTLLLEKQGEMLESLKRAYEQQCVILAKHEKTFENMEQLLQLLSDKLLIEERGVSVRKSPRKSTPKKSPKK